MGNHEKMIFELANVLKGRQCHVPDLPPPPAVPKVTEIPKRRLASQDAQPTAIPAGIVACLLMIFLYILFRFRKTGKRTSATSVPFDGYEHRRSSEADVMLTSEHTSP